MINLVDRLKTIGTTEAMHSRSDHCLGACVLPEGHLIEADACWSFAKIICPPDGATGVGL